MSSPYLKDALLIVIGANWYPFQEPHVMVLLHGTPRTTKSQFTVL